MSHYHSINDDDDDQTPVLRGSPYKYGTIGDKQLTKESQCNRRHLYYTIIIVALLSAMIAVTITLVVVLENNDNDDDYYNGRTSLSFLVVGDWGGKPMPPFSTSAQRDIAHQMGIKANETDSQFTVGLGDNFYDLGVTGVDDPRFNTTFEDVFTAESLQSAWYMVAGNHDHYGTADAQIAYTKRSHRWHMPHYYYTEVFRIGSDATVQFVFIDTELLTTSDKGCLSSNDTDPQWMWINNTLAASTSQWLFVLGHHPVWSVAAHGPTEMLVECLRPLLIQHNVTAYFCGHDHTMQHLHEEDSTVEYFISGAGHNTNPSQQHADDVPPNSLKFRYAPLDIFSTHGAFAHVFINSTVMNITYVDYEGNDLYLYTTRPTSQRV